MRRGDLADLTAFVTAADQLSFPAAASRLGITPSALSHAMRQLESGASTGGTPRGALAAPHGAQRIAKTR